jgi:hypothetical protein
MILKKDVDKRPLYAYQSWSSTPIKQAEQTVTVLYTGYMIAHKV